MEEIVKLDNVTAYNNMRGVKTLHPLVTLLDLSKAAAMPAKTFNFGLYAVYLKELNCGELKYGRNHYDYQEGTLVFIAPGQVMGVQPGVKTFEPKGWAMLFHPDLIKGTPLGRHIQDYSFFSYDVNEALHVSDKERQIILDVFAIIQHELDQSIDKHSRKLISSNIELLLDYCNRFYDRQFITRDHSNNSIVERFEGVLNGYYSSEKPFENGLPSVAWCASELNLSANYFGDVIKKETGKTAQEYIQEKVIDIAKERIFDLEKSVSQVAYDLGFKYPQHFSRLFKQRVGCTPNEYRVLK
ncbi:AraC family transcriptional regulator [Dyadobacter sp. CY312]|uniref:helix-turn-helix domain-containing protein n=1 Tax=Dyadobacter sp. CY312 TaxID=2907303 RepID=UPI001F47B301|nr:helix-turn-helix transcriptional regulator [Dyadobacter sp. CY312]MCE7040410.1 helix-turn-helix transcriptional regulator [Dyadobacter sp. CY312]